MSDSRHTPGPWRVNNVFIDNNPNRYIVGQARWGGRNIADCGTSVGDDRDTNEANARLIAAAPETAADRDKLKAENASLLAALKVCVTEDGANCFKLREPPEMVNALERRVRIINFIARAAMEKVEG